METTQSFTEFILHIDQYLIAFVSDMGVGRMSYSFSLFSAKRD